MSPQPKRDRRVVAIEDAEEQLVLREAMRLHAAGRTAADIETMTGIDAHEIEVMLFGADEPGTP